ncbi:NADH-cytochrome b5 reductase [Dissophora globulifera]|nr:NADH-cytochrome b5 reductase [Dissophora globulifera]
MLRHGIASIRSSNVRSWSRVATADSVQFTSSHSRISSPIRFYSQKPHKTTFNRGTPGETSARAPRPSFATNLVTFLAVSSLSVGGALYQWNKTRQGDIFSALSSSSEGLTNEKWTPILLTKITPVSAETSLFEFQLPRPCMIPVSSAIYVKDDEIQAMRAYTPVHSTEREQETFQLLIKRYSEGQVSRFMHAAKPGKKVEMRGPVVIWPGGRQDLEQWDEIGMIAGGTGITAMLPIIHTALTNPAKRTKISLLFAAQSPEELYFKDELDQLAKSFSGQFTVRYAVDKAPPSEGDWSGHVGYVNQDMLRGLLPASNAISGATDATTSAAAQVTIKSVVLVCGPESMIRHVAGNRGASGQEPIRGVLGEMGYKKDQVFRFPN